MYAHTFGLTIGIRNLDYCKTFYLEIFYRNRMSPRTWHNMNTALKQKFQLSYMLVEICRIEFDKDSLTCILSTIPMPQNSKSWKICESV